MLKKIFGALEKFFGWLCKLFDSKSSTGSEDISLKPLNDNSVEEPHGDVIFVHGMGGDLFTTWSPSDQCDHWGKWLAEERPYLRYWTLGYSASPSKWFGKGAMSLEYRAVNALEKLESSGVGIG